MKDIKPNYYCRTIKGVEIDVNDIADAFDLGYQAQNAIKYLVRAGRKDEMTLVDDRIKSRHYIDRLIKKHAVAEADANELRERARRAEFDERDRASVDAVAEYIEDLGDKKEETNPAPFTMTPATPEQIAVASAWPCWVFRRSASREYMIAGPYPTRDAARRALDPGRTDERVVMADDPYKVEADVVERLFT